MFSPRGFVGYKSFRLFSSSPNRFITVTKRSRSRREAPHTSKLMSWARRPRAVGASMARRRHVHGAPQARQKKKKKKKKKTRVREKNNNAGEPSGAPHAPQARHAAKPRRPGASLYYKFVKAECVIWCAIRTGGDMRYARAGICSSLWLLHRSRPTSSWPRVRAAPRRCAAGASTACRRSVKKQIKTRQNKQKTQVHIKNKQTRTCHQGCPTRHRRVTQRSRLGPELMLHILLFIYKYNKNNCAKIEDECCEVWQNGRRFCGVLTNGSSFRHEF